jgi:hypothetical protein
MKPEEIVEKLPQGTLLLGLGLQQYKSFFESQRRDLVFEKEDAWQVRAGTVARMGVDAYKKGWKDNPLELSPLYLKPSEAEIRLRQKEADP